MLSEVAENPSQIGPWCKLFKCVLANPPRGGRSHWRDTLKLIQSRIQKWKDGDLSGLWSDITASVRGLSRMLLLSPTSSLTTKPYPVVVMFNWETPSVLWSSPLSSTPLLKIRESVPGLLINVWYLEDGTLCGSQQDLAAALTIIEAEGPPRPEGPVPE